MCLLILSIAIMSFLAAFRHTHVPDFMLMCCSVCVEAMSAKRARPAKWVGAPRGERATLNIHRAAYEFNRAPHCCMLKEIGKRLGEVN